MKKASRVRQNVAQGSHFASTGVESVKSFTDIQWTELGCS